MPCDQVAEALPIPSLPHTENVAEVESVLGRPASSFARLTSASESTFYLNRAFLDDSDEGIYGLDTKGQVTFVNAAAQRMTGWSADDLKGKTQHSMVHHHRVDGTHYPQEECPIYKALRDGKPHHRDDEVFWRKDGTCFPVKYTSTPVVRHGRLCGAVIVFCDTTDHVRQRAWQHNNVRVYLSIRNRHPLRHTVRRVIYSLCVLMGTCKSRCCNKLVRYPDN